MQKNCKTRVSGDESMDFEAYMQETMRENEQRSRYEQDQKREKESRLEEKLQAERLKAQERAAALLPVARILARELTQRSVPAAYTLVEITETRRSGLAAYLLGSSKRKKHPPLNGWLLWAIQTSSPDPDSHSRFIPVTQTALILTVDGDIIRASRNSLNGYLSDAELNSHLEVDSVKSIANADRPIGLNIEDLLVKLALKYKVNPDAFRDTSK